MVEGSERAATWRKEMNGSERQGPKPDEMDTLSGGWRTLIQGSTALTNERQQGDTGGDVVL